MQKTLGWIMLFAGMFMLLLSYTNLLAVLVVDNTPPQITYTVPANGQTVGSVNSFTMWANDGESGLASMSVTFYDPSGTQIFTASKTCNGETGTVSWNQPVSPAITTQAQNYKAKYYAKNMAGLEYTYEITFSIYTGLQGKWYINDIEIKSSSQVVYSTTNNVKFTFIKTSGAPDGQIACAIYIGNEVQAGVPWVSAGKWEATYPIANGRYEYRLVATDWVTSVEMAVIDLHVGPEGFELPQLNMLQMLGLASAGIGLVLILFGKPK
jgi:hypothetical protein